MSDEVCMSMMVRRSVIVGGLSLASTCALAQGTSGLGEVKALFFDVFGTLVDWRSGAAREVERILKPRGITLDWAGFAEAWRAEYSPTLEEVRSGRMPYIKLDPLELQMLNRVLPRFGVQDLPDTVKQELNLAWHRLDGWPDAKPGLARLARRYRLAACSNGNISLMADIAARNGWRWDAILGADIAHDYKPNRDVYLAAADAFDLKPAQCMMVACHDDDLNGASKAGLHTAFIPRPLEHSATKGPEKLTGKVDVQANSLIELADKLGA
jgi:2-haloacid dehalogenase